MYLDYLKNNFILCSVFGVFAVLIAYIDSKRNNEKYSLKNYGKIFAMVTICCYIVLYMKSNNILGVSTPLDKTLFSSSSAPWSGIGGSASQTGGASAGGNSGNVGVNLDNYNSVNIGEPNF
jgi:hypothetical protein